MKIINKLTNFIEKIQSIIWKVEYGLYRPIIDYFEVKKYKKLYPDYEDNDYNMGSLKYIWGVKSWDDLTGKESNLYTMNDIDITYDRETKEYMLGIETAYIFKNKESECKYLRQLLDAFTKFMDDKNYSKDYNVNLFMINPANRNNAESIEELYINFKVFVEGFCKIYGF